jgi:hypothetical protein
MDLSGMTWHPPWYVSWSILAMLLFPLFVAPVLKRAGVWFTTAHGLLILVPLFHFTTLAYLGIRSVFLGMSLAGTDSPVVLAAGLDEAHGMLTLGAIFSGIVLVIAFGIAVLHARRTATNSIRITSGRLARTIATTSGLLLIGGVFALSFIVPAVSGAARIRLFPVVTIGAIASGVLVILSIASAIWFINRSAPQGEPAIAAASAFWSTFAVDLAIILVTGVASWLAQKWFVRIAIAGA